MTRRNVVVEMVDNAAGGAILCAGLGAAVGFFFGGPIGAIVGAKLTVKSLAIGGAIYGAAQGAAETLASRGCDNMAQGVGYVGTRVAVRHSVDRRTS